MENNMSPEKERMLSKVVKLMAIAIDQAGKPEGVAAGQKAAILMARHSITETELKFANLENGTDSVLHDEDGVEVLSDSKGRIYEWVVRLASSVSKTFNCKLYVRMNNGTVHFLGSEEDIETAIYFLVVLQNYIEQKSWEKFPTNQDKRKAFAIGAWVTIHQRLEQMKVDMDYEIAKNYSGIKDLVVVKDSLVKQAFDMLFEKNKAKDIKYRKKSFDKDAFLAGKEEGKKAPMNLGIN